MKDCMNDFNRRGSVSNDVRVNSSVRTPITNGVFAYMLIIG